MAVAIGYSGTALGGFPRFHWFSPCHTRDGVAKPLALSPKGICLKLLHTADV